MKQKTYYKIVMKDKNDDGKEAYYPAMLGGIQYYNYKSILEFFNIEYIPGEWTFPKLSGSKLSVFSSRKVAMNFLVQRGLIAGYTLEQIKNEDRYRVLPCHVKNPKTTGLYVLSGMGEHKYTRRQILKFWSAYNHPEEKYGECLKDVGTPPDGTVFCDAVMLINKK